MLNKRRLYVIVAAVGLFLLGLAYLWTASHKQPEDALAQVAMPDLTQAISIQITDTWSGYNAEAPAVADYQLTNSGGVLSGMGVFSLGGGDEDTVHTPVQTTTPITVPAQNSRAFLQQLRRITLRKGTYDPSPQVDYYRGLDIAVALGGDTVIFHSEEETGPPIATRPAESEPYTGLSSHSRWRVTINGQDYISTSPEPDQAVAQICTYLHRDEMLDSLVAMWSKRSH